MRYSIVRNIVIFSTKFRWIVNGPSSVTTKEKTQKVAFQIRNIIEEFKSNTNAFEVLKYSVDCLLLTILFFYEIDWN